ncbi:MAG: ribonuclease domain-containing protein [Bacteroidota bacterium]
MPIWLRFLFVCWLTTGGAFAFSFGPDHRAADSVAVAELPYEAQQTLTLIRTGGPFPYARDGVVFGNYEKRLPRHPRGYYLEYTVRTPGQHDRGPRRIIAGERGEYFYTDDHYRTFRRIRE